MHYLAFRGTARRIATDLAPQDDQSYRYIALTFAENDDHALVLAHQTLKTRGFLIATVDGRFVELRRDAATRDSPTAGDMRVARECGAKIVLAGGELESLEDD